MEYLLSLANYSSTLIFLHPKRIRGELLLPLKLLFIPGYDHTFSDPKTLSSVDDLGQIWRWRRNGHYLELLAEFLNHRHWLLAICVNTIWLPPNWNIHTSEQMAPFALLPFLVPYTLSSCSWVCRHLMCAVMCERRCISWPWQCMQTFFTIHAKHRLPTPSERGEQEFHTVLFKLAAFSLKGSTVWHSYWPFISK